MARISREPFPGIPLIRQKPLRVCLFAYERVEAFPSLYPINWVLGWAAKSCLLSNLWDMLAQKWNCPKAGMTRCRAQTISSEMDFFLHFSLVFPWLQCHWQPPRVVSRPPTFQIWVQCEEQPSPPQCQDKSRLAWLRGARRPRSHVFMGTSWAGSGQKGNVGTVNRRPLVNGCWGTQTTEFTASASSATRNHGRVLKNIFKKNCRFTGSYWKWYKEIHWTLPPIAPNYIIIARYQIWEFNIGTNAWV